MTNLQSVILVIKNLLSWAIPISLGVYFAVNVCDQSLSAQNEKTYKQMRLRVVDGLSQPLSGARVDCPELGVSGVTDTFGELVAKAAVVPVAICQLQSKAKTSGKGKGNFKSKGKVMTDNRDMSQNMTFVQQRLVHFEKSKSSQFTFASLEP